MSQWGNGEFWSVPHLEEEKSAVNRVDGRLTRKASAESVGDDIGDERRWGKDYQTLKKAEVQGN
jgi:hypothetical protein